MALTTDARVEITAALRTVGLPAFPYLPATVSLPAVIITPAEPYILPDRIGRTLTYTARFRVSLLAQALDNESGLRACEELIDATLAAMPDGVLVARVGPPLLDDLGAQGSAYVADMDITAHVTGEAPPPPPPPEAPPNLYLDLYATNFVRLMTDPILDDLATHTVMFALAPAPGPNGEVFADNAALASHGSAAVWFDHGGALGHVKTNSGGDLTATLAARYMREERTIEGHVDMTDPAHPVFQIDFAHLPPTH